MKGSTDVQSLLEMASEGEADIERLHGEVGDKVPDPHPQPW
jgi:hypothetical protein